MSSVDQALRKAKLLAKNGKGGEAEHLLRSVLERFPNNKRVIDALQRNGRPPAKPGRHPLTKEDASAALALYQHGKLAEAQAAVSALLAHHPDVAFLHNLAGAVQAAQGQAKQAVTSYGKALALKPDSADVHNNLGEALNALGRHVEAETNLRKALKINPGSPEALNNLANALSRLGRPQEAIAALEQALANRPGYPEALNGLGNAYNDLGRSVEAIASFEAAIAARPAYAEAHRNLSTIKNYTEGDPQIVQMEQALKSANSVAIDRQHLSFALGKAYEQTGRPDAAFQHYREGNRLCRQATNDPISDARQLFDTIRRNFEKPVPTLAAVTDSSVARPIFVVGMPRSGTSLVEQILASHSQVYGAGELQLMRRAVTPALSGKTPDTGMLTAIRTSYQEGITDLGVEAPVIIDKMPLNFRWIGFIAAAFPEAVIIHTIRDPIATGWSIYKHFFPARGLEFTTDLADIAAYYRHYEELIAFWHERFPGRICDLDYETLTENQDCETRKLLETCNLEWEDSCLEFHKTERVVATASTAQVRQRMYAGSSDAWKPYERYLAALASLKQ